MIDLFNHSLNFSTWALLFLVAFFIGMAKTGVHGVSMFAVPVLAILFGAKASTGLMLPMMVVADLFAVKYYHRHANWNYLLKLFPSAAVGIFLGTWFGNLLDEVLFTNIMSVIIFASLFIMILMERTHKSVIPNNTGFAIFMGLLGGVSTMIGNLAGPIMALYLLSMRLPKNEYIGTAAWFFLVINLFKVPFHVFSWQTIDIHSVQLNLVSIPFIALGAWSGIWIVKRVPDKQYRWLVIAMTGVAAVFMLF